MRNQGKQYQNPIEELIFKANEEIANYIQSEEDIKELLNFKNQFHLYSLRNQSLIQKQFEGAFAVGSYKFWKDHGFSPRYGEKGIEVMVKADVTYFETETGEKKQLKYATKEEKEKIKRGELKTRRVNSYKKGHVWDISQTTATEDDLPKLFPNRWTEKNVNNYSSFYRGLEKVAEHINVKIIEPPYELGVAKGVSFPMTKEVALNPRNGELQNIKTLIHELAHAKLHTLESRKNYSKEEREFQAELVSYAICFNYGLDTSEYAIPYMKSWVKDSDIPKRVRLLSEIYDTSKEYIKIIDQHLVEEKNKERETDKINLKECGLLLRHFGRESINANEEMYFLDVEDFEDLLEDGLMTKENWEQFERDLDKFKLVENGYLEIHTDFENFEKDKDKIDCVITGYMDFWKKFNQEDWFINNKFPNKNFRKIIVEQLLDRHDGTTDIFKSDLEVLKKFEVLNLEKHKLTDIKGIENFESLRKLDVSNNPIINLDVSDLIGLKELYAYGCHLHNIYLPQSETLETLDVTLNNLDHLDLYKQSVLLNLSCSYNELSELDVAQCPSLEVLQCSDNNLTELILNNNEALVTLECGNNQLELLQIENISKFEVLSVRGNAKSEQELLERETINDLFPDENFRKAILENVFDQESNDPNRNIYKDQLDVIKAHQVLLISNSQIHDLKGIEQFTSLYHLDVSFNPIQTLKGISDECEKIYAHSTHLNELRNEDIPKDITTLDVSFCHLKTLDVSNREELQFLFCSHNELEDLKFKNCDNLFYLTCQSNMLYDLPVKQLHSLEQLDCANNFIYNLEVSDGIQWLSCHTNRLTELKLNHCDDLEHLECAFNNLHTLEIQALENLKNIDCRGNERSPHELIHGVTKEVTNEQEKER